MTGARLVRIVFRLSFLIAAAGVLAWRCREGVSPFEVGVAFTVYVAAATLWIRGQYQASVDAAQTGDETLRPWTFPYPLSVAAVLTGAVLVGVGIMKDVGSALLCGVLVAYLGAGYVLMRFRMYETGDEQSRVRTGAAVLIASAALTVVGLLVLENYTWAGFALGIGVLSAPIGLAVLAEPAIRWLQKGGHGQLVAGAVAVAAVALAVDAGIAVARVDTKWILLLFAALALLVLAIVSSTQADIAAVIAAVSLVGVTPMSEEKPDALSPQSGQERVLVALGDSYMSGEGADIYYSEEVDKGQEGKKNHCNRAPTAWAAMAGRTRRLFDSVAFLACSGARTFNVRHERPPPKDGGKPEPQYNEPGTQLDQVDSLKNRLGVGFDPSLVVVSLGGNDAGFSTIGMMCLAPGDCIDKRELWESNLDEVGVALKATFDEIRAEFPKAPVLVIPYPAPIYAGKRDKPCDEVALSARDKEFITEFLPALNETVKQAAESRRFYFLAGMETSLADAHLQLCDPDNDERPGINFIGLRSVGGIAEQRFNPANWYHNSLHPNERGHTAMLQVFEQWRAENPDPKTDDPSSPASAASEKADGPKADQTKPEPPCDLFDDRSTKVQCREAGAEWAKGQLSDTILLDLWGLQIAVGTLAAWVLGVALFGWWKPWWPPRPSATTAGVTAGRRPDGARG